MGKLQKDYLHDLLELMCKYPDREVMPLVESDVVQSDEYCAWIGSWGMPSLDDYYAGEERIYLKSDGIEDLVDEYMDRNDEELEEFDLEAAEKMATEAVMAYEWVPCICVSISV